MWWVIFISLPSIIMMLLMTYGGDIIDYFKNKRKLEFEMKKMDLEIEKIRNANGCKKNIVISNAGEIESAIPNKKYKWAKLLIPSLIAVIGSIIIPIVLHFVK